MERSKFQYEGMKWLAELEMLDHPQLINTLKLNILMASKSIKETELLIYREKKAMLVLLELTWFGRRFGKKRIFDEVQETLSQLLPSFRFRVTDDPKIMNMAVEKVKQALTGGKYENNSNPSSSVSVQSDVNEVSNADSVETTTGTSESSESNKEEQPIYPDAILPYAGDSDSGEK